MYVSLKGTEVCFEREQQKKPAFYVSAEPMSDGGVAASQVQIAKDRQQIVKRSSEKGVEDAVAAASISADNASFSAAHAALRLAPSAVSNALRASIILTSTARASP